MTKQEVLELIAKYIIKNGDGAITATVLQPILEQMVLQPNILIGRLELLNTTEKDSLVDAINSIITMDITELVETVQLLVENDILQDETISELKNETERLENEKISDAPEDGKQYVRENGQWIEVDIQSNTTLDDVLTNGNISDKTVIISKDDKKSELSNEGITVENEFGEIKFRVDGGGTPFIKTLTEEVFFNNEETHFANNPLKIVDAVNDNQATTLGQVKGIMPDTSTFATKTELTEGLETKVGEAPEDGKVYVRENGSWVDFDTDTSQFATKTELTDGLNSLDLNKVTSNGNATKNNLVLQNEDENHSATYSVNGILFQEEGHYKSGVVRESNHLRAKFSTSNLDILDGRFEVNKPFRGVDAIHEKDFVTKEQLDSKGVQTGFGLTKDEDGKIRLGEPFEAFGGDILKANKPFVIGNIVESGVYGLIVNIDEDSNTSFANIQAKQVTLSSQETLNLETNGEVNFLINTSAVLNISNERISTNKAFRGIDAVAPNDLVTKRQLDSKNYITSPDGSKWGVTNEGTLYKIV